MRAPCSRSYVRGMTDIASTVLRASPPSAAWLRILALVYDPFLWLGEIAGMRRPRTRAPRDRTRAPLGWAVAVHRTRTRELALPRGVPGQPAPTVAPLRRRLPLQPPDRGADAH